MKITLDLSAYEIELLKDSLMSRKEELHTMALEDYDEGNRIMMQEHLKARAACSLIYDYIVDMSKISE